MENSPVDLRIGQIRFVMRLLLSIFLASSSLRGAPQPVVLYQFDEKSGAKIVDQSGAKPAVNLVISDLKAVKRERRNPSSKQRSDPPLQPPGSLPLAQERQRLQAFQQQPALPENLHSGHLQEGRLVASRHRPPHSHRRGWPDRSQFKIRKNRRIRNLTPGKCQGP